MRQCVITRFGTPEVLQVVEKPDPEPGTGQLRVRVKAAGINFADILARKGLYPDAPKPPCVVGYEVSGVVDKVGEQVDSQWVGKEVVAMTRFGGYADTVIVSEHQLFEKPSKLSFEEAVAIPVNYLTAWQLIVVMGALKADETILIHNAGGGVGLAALDIARHLGARTIGTASGQKHSFLKERGYDELIDYRREDWFPRVMEITEGKGVHLVIDPIGGANWKKSYKALRSTGRLGMYGISSVTKSSLGGKLRFLPLAVKMPWFNPVGLMNSNRGVFGVNLGHMWSERERVKEWMKAILKGVEEGWVRPHVDKAFKLQNAAQAHRYIEERRNIGKVVLVP